MNPLEKLRTTKLNFSKTLLLDIEAEGLDPYKVNKIHCCWVWSADGSYKKVFHENDKESLAEVLSSAEYIVAHNGICYDFPCLRNVGIISDISVLDTLVLSRMVFPDIITETLKRWPKTNPSLLGNHSIEAWGARFGKAKGEFKGPWDQWSQEMEDYCYRDVEILYELFNLVWNHSFNCDDFRVREHKVAELIHQQETNGIQINFNKVCALGQKLQKDITAIIDQLDDAFPPIVEEKTSPQYWYIDTPTGRLRFPTKKIAKMEGYRDKEIFRGPNRVVITPFNPGSSQQIADRLIEKYDWKPEKYTEPSESYPEGQICCDESVLSTLDYPEAKLLVDYMILDKRYGQVISGKQSWINHIQGDRIYGRVNTLGTRTTRMSHYSPNLGQVPAVGHPYGYECRECFEPRPSWKLVGCDAKSLEAFMLGHYLAFFGDKEFAQLILEGDLHSENAKVLGCERYDAKTWFYAMIYGAGVTKLGSILKGDYLKGQEAKDRFFKRFPPFGKLVDFVQQRTKDRGYLLAFGNTPLISIGMNSALNTLLQGSGAIVMKEALIILDQKLQSIPRDSWNYCLNVHDEWQLECDPEYAEFIGVSACDAITEAGVKLGCKYRLSGEYKIGNNWAETH